MFSMALKPICPETSIPRSLLTECKSSVLMRSLRFTLANRSVASSAMKALLTTPLAPDMGELKARISGISLASSGEMVLALEPLSITNSPVAFFPTSVWQQQKMPECKGLAECFWLRRVTVFGSGRHWLQAKLACRHVQRDQVL